MCQQHFYKYNRKRHFILSLTENLSLFFCFKFLLFDVVSFFRIPSHAHIPNNLILNSFIFRFRVFRVYWCVVKTLILGLLKVVKCHSKRAKKSKELTVKNSSSTVNFKLLTLQNLIRFVKFWCASSSSWKCEINYGITSKLRPNREFFHQSHFGCEFKFENFLDVGIFMWIWWILKDFCLGYFWLKEFWWIL